MALVFFFGIYFLAVDLHINQIKIPLFQKTAFYISFCITLQLFNRFQKRATPRQFHLSFFDIHAKERNGFALLCSYPMIM
ncbi:hypothetical protein D4R51_00560 [bacterium]|nr:MAG: hypothetical protein D4R51_00560 [bacterium]